MRDEDFGVGLLSPRFQSRASSSLALALSYPILSGISGKWEDYPLEIVDSVAKLSFSGVISEIKKKKNYVHVSINWANLAKVLGGIYSVNYPSSNFDFYKQNVFL